MALDRHDRGVAERWFDRLPQESITFPGSLTTNGKGDRITLTTPWTGQIVDSSWFKSPEYAEYRADDNLKIPAWLQPIKYYKGAAWYTREIDLSEAMSGKPLEVYLERVHWESILWIDGRLVGSQNSLGTPHRYLVEPLTPGRHLIALRIDNRIKAVDVGYNAHSISDHTQGNWNGVIGQMYLESVEPVSIRHLSLYPDIDSARVKVEVWIENLNPTSRIVTVDLTARSKFTPTQQILPTLRRNITLEPGLSRHKVTYAMGSDFYLWDEFTPYLYTMSATLIPNSTADTHHLTHGNATSGKPNTTSGSAATRTDQIDDDRTGNFAPFLVAIRSDSSHYGKVLNHAGSDNKNLRSHASYSSTSSDNRTPGNGNSNHRIRKARTSDKKIQQDIISADKSRHNHAPGDRASDNINQNNAISADKSLQSTLDDRAAAQVMSSDFGMRKFESRDKRFYINDRPIFLRGTLECAIFPKTGYPAMTEAEWARIFNICRAHGLNHVRFHSWCPPRAAFRAADRLGVYLQVEGGGWCIVGDGNEFDRWIFDESDRILAEYGNHPSFVLYTYGNEPDGANQASFLARLVDHLKVRDSRHLYTSAAGWPMIPQNEYRNDSYPRLKIWGADSPLNSARPRYDYQFDDLISKCAVPWVSHEIGQWCVYPDFREIDRYSDAVLQARNFEIFRETLHRNGLSQHALTFMLNSGKLQTLLYKTEIESALRTRDFAGFQLLDLHDFPGQGTALVGVLNAFWESKGYVSAPEYHRFSSPVVPLIRLDRAIFRNNEMLRIPVEIANFGATALTAVIPSWRLASADGTVFASGNLARQDIPLGNCISLGTICQSLSAIQRATQLTLTVDVPGGSNSWNLWIYPHDNDNTPSGDVRIVRGLDQQTLDYLKNGGKVLLTPTPGALCDKFGGDIRSGFTTIFWNSAWTRSLQPPLTLGLQVNSRHAALADFPTESHSDYQWYEFITNANTVNLTALGTDIEPIVRVIDDWFRNRSLGLIFEARVGTGKLLYCGSDLSRSSLPEVAQMKKSLLEYMNSDAFDPQSNLSEQQITSILK